MFKLGSLILIVLASLTYAPAVGAETPPSPASGQSFRDCSECPEMVAVPAGSFLMGAPPKPDPDAMDTSLPQHKVRIAKPFAAGKFAVKFEEWDACLADGECGGYKPDAAGHGRGSLPAVNVSWNDAKAYVAWLSKKTGKPYRLLSEAEWEYAARAGSASKTFAEELWDDPTYDDPASGRKSPAQPNAWGLRGVYGRPTQWVEDCWNDTYKGAPRNGAAWTKGDCTQHVLRGGSGEEEILVALRGRYSADTRDPKWGFRVARPLAP